MRRIRSACLLQTIHFLLKEDLDRETAASAVKAEVEHYKAQLRRSCTRYRIEDETVQPDGSVVMRIRKQYNSYDCGEYIQ